MNKKQLATNLLIVIGSILLTVLLLEGAARWLLGVQPTPARFQLNPLLGWEWTPGYDAVEPYKGTSYRMTINEQGLRNDDSYAVPKPPETYRIIALGDSVVAAPGVALADTFVKQLEQLIQVAIPDHTVEVVNAGTDDYGTEQELIWLREKGLSLDPDLLILHIYLNDSRGFNPPSPRLAAVSNFFNRHSALYTWYREQLQARMAAENVAQDDFRFRYLDTLAAEKWITDPAALTTLIQEADRDWGLAWYEQELRHIQAQVSEIADLTRTHDVPLLLVFFPVSVQVYAQVDTPLDLTDPQYALAQFAEQAGLPYLDLLPRLKAIRDEDLYFDQVHLKTVGHKPVALAIREALMDAKLLPIAP